MRTIMTLLLALLMLCPVAAADHRHDEDAAAAGFYVVLDDHGQLLGLWEETNSHDGLQTTPTCNEEGEVILEPDLPVFILGPEEQVWCGSP